MKCAMGLLLVVSTSLTIAAPPAKVRNVAVVVHENVELLDFAGPAEVFANAGSGGARAFNVYTVAPKAGNVKSNANVTVVPQYTFENCPKPDLLVVPGGNTNVLLDDPTTMAWIRKAAGDAEIAMSVCTGAFTFAKNGLLDGQSATTHWSAIRALRQDAPKATVLENVRFVDNGHIVTTAGISAGIDGALHVVERLLGKEEAWDTARGMEYRWEPELKAGAGEAERAENEALRAFVFRDWSAAAQGYGKLIVLRPSDADAYFHLATAQSRGGSEEEGLANLKKAMALGYDAGPAWSAIGRAELALKRNQDACASLEKAVAAGQKDSTTVYNLACAHALCGRKDAALEALGLALDAGFRNRRLLQTDSDLDSLRSEARFKELSARLGS